MSLSINESELAVSYCQPTVSTASVVNHSDHI